MIQRILLTLLANLALMSCTVGVARPSELTAIAAQPSPEASSADPVSDVVVEWPAAHHWRIETIDYNGLGNSSLALDSHGLPHISYPAGDPDSRQLKYARWTGYQWLFERAASMELGGSTFLALDGNDAPHMVFSSCNPWACQTSHARLIDGHEWTVSQWPGVTRGSAALALDLDSQGNPHAVYHLGNVVNDQNLLYIHWTGSAWITATVDAGPGELLYPSLELDGADRPHLSYYGANDLRYASWTGSAWDVQVVDPVSHTGQYSSLALDSLGRPHISYYDSDSQSLKYARWTGQGWDIQTLDAGDVGRFTSLALDAYDHPHVAYLDDAQRAIKYIYWTGRVWRAELIEARVGKGDTISLALDAQNAPHISYSQYTETGETRVKYAVLVSEGMVAQPNPATLPLDAPLPSATPAPAQTTHDTQTRPTDGMLMVAVPGGVFLMGSIDADIDAVLQWCAEHSVDCQREWFAHEQPAHLVSLDSFWIDRTEVSNAQYKRCVDAGACQSPTTCHFGEPTFEDASNAEHPAICVDWYGAQAYCQWAGARLPTEAEWEYAARGPDGNTFPWGEELDGTRLNFCDANCTINWQDTRYNDGYERTAPVQSFENGASWCGALNMAGNVAEWVDDWYNSYPGASYQSERFGAQYKVTRGNTWQDYLHNARSAARSFHTPTTRAYLVGFRCAATSAP